MALHGSLWNAIGLVWYRKQLLFTLIAKLSVQRTITNEPLLYLFLLIQNYAKIRLTRNTGQESHYPPANHLVLGW